MADEDLSTPGGRIRVMRKAKDLKQEAFAIKVGCSQAAISQWENNAWLPGKFWRWKIADELGCAETWLFGDISERKAG